MKKFPIKDLDPRFENTAFIVDATHEEKFQLWKIWNTVCVWKDDGRGASYLLGTMNDGEETLPVYLTCWWADINGFRVLFYEMTSLVTHRGWAEEFVVYACKKPKWDVARLAHTNATNFHHVVNYIGETTGKPFWYPESYIEF